MITLFKLPRFCYRSFAARMTFFVVLVSGVLLCAFALIINTIGKDLVTQDATKRAQSELRSIDTYISEYMDQVEVALRYSETSIVDSLGDFDKLDQMLLRIITLFPKATGSAAVFLPNTFLESSPEFGRYATRSSVSRELSVKPIEDSGYDHQKRSWFTQPLASNQGHWADPYFDKGLSDVCITTYSIPLHDTNQRVIGVLTLDIKLDKFQHALNISPLYPSSYAFVLGRRGHFLLEHDENSEKPSSIFDLATKEESPELQQVGNSMIAGKSGMQNLVIEGRECYLFYSPVSDAGWSLGLVCDKEEVYAGIHRLSMIMLGVLLIGLIILVWVNFGVVSHISKPLKEFSKVAQEIAKGHFNVALPVMTNEDEMNDLRNSFDFMMISLESYMNALQETTTVKERIESELRIAHDIQMSMIPKIFPPFPERTDIDLFAILRPAKEVGGDFYDFFIEHERLYFVIGDVSGKGVPASLVMAVTRSLFRSLSTDLGSACKIVEAINHAIAEENENNMFITLFVGVLDLKTYLLDFCNAGHNPLVLLSKTGAIDFLKLETNIPVGSWDGFLFQSQILPLCAGDQLLLYTDGLTEAENDQGVFYGDEHLLQQLRRLISTDRCLPVREVVSSILKSVADHVKGAEQSDDLAILSIALT